MTRSIGNLPGRRWPLKKWMTKMKPIASVASAPWTNRATLNIQPGSTRDGGQREPEHQPRRAHQRVPQSTAQ